MVSGRSNKSFLHKWAIELLRIKPLGYAVACLTDLVGLTELSRKISPLCGFVPSTVKVVPPDRVAGGRWFSINGVRGLDPVSRSLWWGGWKGYECPFPDLFAACSLESRLVLDIGAFSGLYSLIAATCSPGAKIYAFEPYPPARRLLEANVHRNRLENRITVVPVALSDHAGSATLFVPPTTTALLESASSLNNQLYSQPIDRVEVPVITLASFLQERDIGSVDLVKMDVETHEPEVLLGASQLFRRCRPVVFLEILASANIAELDAIRAGVDYIDGLLVEGGAQLLDRVRYVPKYNNHILCPREKLDWFRERVELVGYRILAG